MSPGAALIRQKDTTDTTIKTSSICIRRLQMYFLILFSNDLQKGWTGLLPRTTLFVYMPFTLQDKCSASPRTWGFWSESHSP